MCQVASKKKEKKRFPTISSWTERWPKHFYANLLCNHLNGYYTEIPFSLSSHHDV